MAVLRTLPLGGLTLYECDDVPVHVATNGDLAVNKAGDADTFLYEYALGSWTANVSTGGGGGGGAPTTADYLTKTANGSLSAERVVTDTTEVPWDWTVAGQAKAGIGTVSGAKIAQTVVTKTANYTLTSTDYVALGNAAGGAFTFTLPAVAASTNRAYRVKKIDASANTVTVQGNAAETIDGANTAVLTRQYESIDLVCDGTTWNIA
jgi:hypothetical protein